jgi:serine phosphatase RsbU (regulator of sigma subunit)
VNVFATVVLAQVDPDTHEMRWSNAGHPPPLLLQPDGTAHLLEARAEPLLGTRFGGPRSNHSVQLQPGASVVLYTDGLVERRDRGFDAALRQLREALTGRADFSAEQLCDHLSARFAADPEDDIVLTVVRRHPG